MQKHSHSILWFSLFTDRERPGRLELLLSVMLINFIRVGCEALFQSRETFLIQHAFSPKALGVRGVGWAAWLPPSLIVSQLFNRGVAFVLAMSAACWLLKRGLIWSPVVTALSYGLLVSLRLSRNMYYVHPSVAFVFAILVYSAFYLQYRIEINSALIDNRFWDEPLYPRWVLVLILTYMGTYYGFAGIQKLRQGWLSEWSGLTLQLLLCPAGSARPGLPLLAKPLVASRQLATLAMATTLVLELGALIGLLWRPLRPWWASGLIGMHLMIGLTMRIWFVPPMIILALVGLPFDHWLTATRARLRRAGLVIHIVPKRLSPSAFLLLRAIYAVDLLGLLNFEPCGTGRLVGDARNHEG